MRQIRPALIGLLILLLYTCKSSTEEEQRPWPDQRLNRWLSYYKVTMDDFEKSGRFPRTYPVEREFSPSEAGVFQNMFVYSPDSSLAIDLDSYHLILDINEDGELYSPGREVDMEVGLINLSNEKRERLLFCGTVCLFEEATFQPDSHIVVAGFTENSQGYHPTLWTINLNLDSLEIRKSPATIEPEAIHYTAKERLDHIHFRHSTPPSDKGLDIPL